MRPPAPQGAPPPLPTESEENQAVKTSMRLVLEYTREVATSFDLALWLAASSYHHSQLPLAPLGTHRYWTHHDYHLQSPTLITLVYRLASGVFALLYFRQRH